MWNKSVIYYVCTLFKLQPLQQMANIVDFLVNCGLKTFIFFNISYEDLTEIFNFYSFDIGLLYIYFTLFKI